MTRLIHARLDDHTAALLRELKRQLGWNEARVVREGIKAMNGVLVRGPNRRRIHGMGRFRSGVSDLGSKKKHLLGFGR